MAVPRTAACVTLLQKPSTYVQTIVGLSTRPMDLSGTAELSSTLLPLCLVVYTTCAATGITSPHSARPYRPMLWPVRPLGSQYDPGDLEPSAVRFDLVYTDSLPYINLTLLSSLLLVFSFVVSRVQPLPSLHQCLPSLLLRPHCTPVLCSPLH